MSTDPAAQAGQPSEDELRAAYEAELSRITSADMILQTAVSLLNLGGRRLGLAPGAEGERDLEQVRDAVDGVSALLAILERSAPQEMRPLRDALAQLQMAYAREAQAGGGANPSAQQGQPAGAQRGQPASAQRGQPASQQNAPAGATKPGAPAAAGEAKDKPGAPGAEEKPGAGPAESSGRLWVPGR
jgi:hypothetical protein